ncbi:hypothetical protein [Nocardia higoensis]|uniref:hypothetical protein n=1 Tax=Nocardia higoensis TaxID=228599 RepID=UPI0002EC6295|nr:hypothetical protein [Nocardia higoensis]
MKFTRGVIAAFLAGVLALSALLVIGFGGYRYWNAEQEKQAREQALEAANTAVPAMFSYEYTTVDTELPKAAELLSPAFREDYLKLIGQAIVPGAKEKQLTVLATAQAGGVVEADRDRAVVMLFLNQVTTSKDSPQGTTTGSRVRVALDRDGDRWLVDAVTPI